METPAHDILMRAASFEPGKPSLAVIARQTQKEYTISTTENKLRVGELGASGPGDCGRPPLFYTADSILYWLFHSSQSRVSDFIHSC